jgi:type IV fimbrial biogenesis protein FimT
MKPVARFRAGGFSMIELAVVLAVAAVLLGVGIPNLRPLIEQQRLRSTVNDLFAALDLTRSEAIGRGSRVELAPADPRGADWNRGWVVFVDRNGNQRPDAGDEVIFSHGPVADGISIVSAFSSGGAPYLAYNGAGRSCSATSSLAARWGTLSLFQGSKTRRIKINMLGRARVCDPQLQASTCSGLPAPL